MKVGIPRALLYHRFYILWDAYFKELGIETVLSPKTDKIIMEKGEHYGIDESCLSSKLFWGHVDWLAGKCDTIFVPRIANYGKEGYLCSRFEALYDTAVNTFRDKNIRFVCCNVDEQQKITEEKAYAEFAVTLGKTKSDGKKAYQKAYVAYKQDLAAKEQAQAELLKKDGIKVLMLGHSYNLYDEYIGIPILNTLKKLDTIPILADHYDFDKARQQYTKICKDIPWFTSRELVGALAHYENDVDGIILLTAFPCGPDSMVNEMIIRRVHNKPILNLLLDSQDGNAGIDTRLESFIDIIRFRKGAAV